MKKPVIIGLVVMKLLVVALLLSIFLRYNTTSQEDLDIAQCIENVKSYTDSEKQNVFEQYRQCLVFMESETCEMFKDVALQFLQINENSWIEVCKSEKGVIQYD